MPVRLAFQGGTLRIEGLAAGEAPEGLPPSCLWDEREAVHRAPAIDYAAVVMALRARGVEVTDDARHYQTLTLAPAARAEPFPYQTEALEAWGRHRFRGVVVLPTGAGKTYVATLAVLSRQRSTLVVVPTLDLLNQWYDVLRAAFGVPVGLVGGGYHEVLDLTVTTYDSAHLHMERLGDRFGLVVFDECHHLPSASYATAARMCLAPFRLGLTATPERADGRTCDETVGPLVYRKDITELSGEYLAEFDPRHLLSAVIMTAPGTLLMAKMLVPETEQPKTAGRVIMSTEEKKAEKEENLLGAIARGTTDGLHLALNIAAMLISFLALIALTDGILGGIHHWINWFPESLEKIFGVLFAPVAWVIGVPWRDCGFIGTLLGTRMALNELVAFSMLGPAKGSLDPRSFTIATFALCGFANLSSIGIQIGGIGALAPNKKSELARLGIRAMLAGTMANLMSASIAGMLL